MGEDEDEAAEQDQEDDIRPKASQKHSNDRPTREKRQEKAHLEPDILKRLHANMIGDETRSRTACLATITNTCMRQRVKKTQGKMTPGRPTSKVAKSAKKRLKKTQGPSQRNRKQMSNDRKHLPKEQNGHREANPAQNEHETEEQGHEQAHHEPH